MVACEVQIALERYARLSADRGALVINSLRPGADAAHIQAVEDRYGIRLTDDARAVWSWHDGVALDHAGNYQWFGGRFVFLDLESAARLGAQTLDILKSGDPKRYPDSAWLDFMHRSIPSMMAISDPEVTDTRVLLAEPIDGWNAYPILTVAETINLWNVAVESGAWIVKDDGLWWPDEEKFPTDARRNLM